MVLENFPDTLHILLTPRCNLNCSYCYVNRDSVRGGELRSTDLKKGIERFLEVPGQRKVISFSGGEPLLRFRELMAVCRYLKEKSAESGVSSVSVVTNGTLLNKKSYNLIKRNKINLRISIDGKKEFHDRNRKFSSVVGGSSYARVTRNIKAILRDNDGGSKIGASLVFTPDTAAYLVKNIEFLRKLGFAAIDFYPELYARWSDDQLNAFGSVMKEFTGYYISLFSDSKGEKKRFTNSLLHNFINEKMPYKSLVCKKVHLGWDGNFYYCDKAFSLPRQKRGEFVIGNIEKGIDNSLRLKMLERTRRQIEKDTGIKCKACKYLRYCLCPIGHCIYFTSQGVAFKPYFRQFCRISKIYIKSFLDIKKAINSSLH